MERQGGGKSTYARIGASLSLALMLVGCGGLGLLPSQTDIQNTQFHSYKEVASAYDDIQLGVTRSADLAQIGFDTVESPNVEMVSYLGIIERFMPRDSIKFDLLDPAVKTCIEARDRCTAMIFRPERLRQERTGNWLLDVLGFERTTVNYGWTAEVTLLVLDGRVAYKVMSGKPNIQDYHDKVQPLGPFQDLGNTVVHTASVAANL